MTQNSSVWLTTVHI